VHDGTIEDTDGLRAKKSGGTIPEVLVTRGA